MNARSILLGALMLALVGCVAGEAAPERARAGARYPDLAVGIAPFAVFSEPGTVLPDAGALVGARLGSRGVGRVVPGDAAGPEPSNTVVREWAATETLDAVIEGRLTQFGEAISLDVRLRRPSDGSVVGTFSEEAKTLAAVPEALDSLTDRLLGATVLLSTLPASGDVATAPSAPPATGPDPGAGDSAGEAADAPGEPFGFRSSGGPLSITSDSLESDDRKGRRTIVFSNNVVAQQGDLRVTCDRLEAHYPGGGKQPTKLLARGHVELSQGEQSAVCDEAEFNRDVSKLICRGNASFRENDNELHGDVIEIDLATESVKALGRTRFVVNDESEGEVAP